MNDFQVGRAARALRHRLRLRQVDVGDRAGLGHDLVSRVERGRLDGLTVRSLRRLFAVFDADIAILVRWRGGELDRIVDRKHATLGERLLKLLERDAWIVLPEVSFSEYGERGSIDLLAWHPATRTLLVVELKTELTSVEETIRRHDAKVRLAAKVAMQRFEWNARVVARLLVLPDERTPRRQVERFQTLLTRAYPTRGRDARAWLARPASSISGLVFLSSADRTRLRRRIGPTRRITNPGGRAEAGANPSGSDAIGR